MKIVVTGATGFVGGHLTRQLLKLGHQITCLGRQDSPPDQIKDRVRWIQSDLSEAVPNIDCDMIIHAAAKADDVGSYLSFHNVNVKGTVKLLEACKEWKKVIYISSGSVYSHGSAQKKEQDADLHTLENHYGKTKLMAEEVIKTHCKRADKDFTILRPRAIYGTHDRVLLPRLVSMIKGNMLVTPGDLNVQCSLTSVKNLVKLVQQLVEKPTLAQRLTVNVCDIKSYLLKQVILDLCEMLAGKALDHRPIPVRLLRMFTPLLNTIQENRITQQAIDYLNQPCVLSTSLMQSTFDTNQFTTFENELRHIVEWAKEANVGQNAIAQKALSWTA